MSTVETLTEHFRKFPGIGPRQAKRFVYFLLTRDNRFREDLSSSIKELSDDVLTCQLCYRFFVSNNKSSSLCAICSNQNRDIEKLMVIEKDVDLDNIERSGDYKGNYFVLGGTIPILEKDPKQYIRSDELEVTVKKRAETKVLKEIIMALSNNPEGDNTLRFLNEILIPLGEKYNFIISVLGRGLSTGSELEYSDADTIKNAFENRH